MDSSVNPDTASDTETNDAELPVRVDSVMIDGVAPSPGDHVNLTVGATVTRVVNDILYAKPETVNDAPIPAPMLDTNDMVSEGDRLKTLSQNTGMGDY